MTIPSEKHDQISCELFTLSLHGVRGSDIFGDEDIRKGIIDRIRLLVQETKTCIPI